MGASIRKTSTFPLQNQPGLGVRVICDLPRTADLENFLIKLSGIVTLSTGAAALVTDGIWNMIQEVSLIGDGRDTIVSIPFNVLGNGNMFRRKWGSVSQELQPLLTIAAQPFEASAFLDLAAFGALRPKDSNLRETRYKTLQLALRFANDWTGVFSGGGFVVSGQTLALEISGQESIELADSNGNASGPIFRQLVSSRDDTVTGAVTRQRFKLSPDQILRGLGLRTVTAANALADTVLDKVRVYVGNDLRFELPASALKTRNKTSHIAAVKTGYYFMDFADMLGSSDRLNDALDVRREVVSGADCYFEYDSLVAGTVNVTQYGLVAP